MNRTISNERSSTVNLMNYLKHVGEDLEGPEGHAHALHGVHEGLDQVGRVLEHVWPHEVHEVSERVLAAEAEDAERHVLDGRARSLTMNQVAEIERTDLH